MDQNDFDVAMNDGPEPQGTPAPGDARASAPQPDDASFNEPAGVTPDELDALLHEAQQLAGGSPAQAPAPVLADAAGAALVEELMATAGHHDSPASESPAHLPLEAIPLPEFDLSEIAKQANQPLSLLYDVEMHVKIELGRTHMYVEDVLKLGEGSVVELDRLAGDPVDVFVNGRLVARGEVLVLNDNFCVRVSEIISDPQQRLVG